MTPEQEKSFEYQQVAALLAIEIEMKHEMVHHRDDWTKEQLIEVFDELAEEREKVISNQEYRENKWHNMSLLFSLPVSSE